MASDIFVSYAREDRDFACRLAEELEGRGWSVWWDRDIPVGKRFDTVIAQALREARCVVVLWSAAAVQSRWVRDEAAEAVERGVLVPALIEDMDPPLGFRSIQAAKLRQWRAGEQSEESEGFFASVAALVESGAALGGDPAATEDTSSNRRAGKGRWLKRPVLPSGRGWKFGLAGVLGLLTAVGLVSSHDWGKGCDSSLETIAAAVDDQPAEMSMAAADEVINPRLPLHFDQCHEFMTNVIGWAEGTISEGNPGSVTGTFTLKSYRLEQGVKAFVRIQLLDSRGNILREVRSRTWVDGWLTLNRKHRTESFHEEVDIETQARIATYQVKFVEEQ